MARQEDDLEETTEKIIMKTLDIKEYVLNSIFSQKRDLKFFRFNSHDKN